jgi:hypothetical protein
MPRLAEKANLDIIYKIGAVSATLFDALPIGFMAVIGRQYKGNFS